MSRILRVGLWLAFFSATSARAALYTDLPDAILARRSPVIVLADVVDVVSRIEPIGGQQRPWTVVTLDRQEALRGFSPARFELLIPGGSVGNTFWKVSGSPSFTPGQRVILFLAPLPERQAIYQLTEFALSKFELVEDQMGQQFAVRGLFRSGNQQMITPENPARTVLDGARRYDSFLDALRLFGETGRMPQVEQGHPSGRLRTVFSGVREQWVNLGGREPANLFRWFWDTGMSPDTFATIFGVQTNLRDGSNGTPQVLYAMSTWSGIPNSRVRYLGLAASGGNMRVNLDVNALPGFWSAPMDCNLGMLGLGEVGLSNGPFPFKGDNYFAIQSPVIHMRRNICANGYDPVTFRAGVLHEMGHTLGLGHPDQAQSIHSRTAPADWTSAVMTSSLTPAALNGPQRDDIAAILYYYGTAVANPGSGDVDGNGSVGVSDVFYLINFLFTGGPAPVGNADPNRDSAVSVADIFYLINFLFAGGPAPL